jgi:DNA adenine methylase
LGGKHLLAAQIVSLLPEHKCYCEVFAGGASVFWIKEVSQVEVLNDINSELINLYRVVQYHPNEFYTQIQWLLRSRNEFMRQLAIPSHCLTDIQKAVRTFYIIKNCYGGRYLKPSFGYSTYGNQWFSTRAIEELLLACHRRLERVTLESLPYDECIKKYDSSGTCFYLDPPYWGCEGYYGSDWTREDFRSLSALLRNIKGKFILSLNDTPEVHKIFYGFEFRRLKTRYSCKVRESKQVSEVVFKNF